MDFKTMRDFLKKNPEYYGKHVDYSQEQYLHWEMGGLVQTGVALTKSDSWSRGWYVTETPDQELLPHEAKALRMAMQEARETFRVRYLRKRLKRA